MGIGIDISERVNEKTIEYGIGKLGDVSSTKIQEQLVRIEKYLQKHRKEQNNYLSKYKNIANYLFYLFPRKQILKEVRFTKIQRH